MISVLHIGLPLRLPWLTAEESQEIAIRLEAIRRKMEAAGYRYDVLHASPQEGLAQFRERLRTEQIDAVVIGGGVAGEPKWASFNQQIRDATQDEAPEAKVLEFDHALELPVVIGRAFRTG